MLSICKITYVSFLDIILLLQPYYTAFGDSKIFGDDFGPLAGLSTARKSDLDYSATKGFDIKENISSDFKGKIRKIHYCPLFLFKNPLKSLML